MHMRIHRVLCTVLNSTCIGLKWPGNIGLAAFENRLVVQATS